MFEIISLVLGFLVCVFVGTTFYFFAKAKALESQLGVTSPAVEVKYFESVEDSSGVLKNSRRFIVKSQVYVYGLPIGAPQTVSEHLVEEFSYDKVASLREQVLVPLLKAGHQVISQSGSIATSIEAVRRLASSSKKSEH